jgi:hypothetical protein
VPRFAVALSAAHGSSTANLDADAFIFPDRLLLFAGAVIYNA